MASSDRKRRSPHEAGSGNSGCLGGRRDSTPSDSVPALCGPTLEQPGASEAPGDGVQLQRDSSAVRALLLHHAGIAETTAIGLAAGVAISEAWRRVLMHSADRLREIAVGAK